MKSTHWKLFHSHGHDWIFNTEFHDWIFVRIWNQLNCLWTNKQIEKKWHTCTTDYYSAKIKIKFCHFHQVVGIFGGHYVKCIGPNIERQAVLPIRRVFKFLMSYHQIVIAPWGGEGEWGQSVSTMILPNRRVSVDVLGTL